MVRKTFKIDDMNDNLSINLMTVFFLSVLFSAVIYYGGLYPDIFGTCGLIVTAWYLYTSIKKARNEK